MAVPTWRTQAAPTGGESLRAAADANKQLIAGLGKISKSIDDTSETYGDIIKNEAYTTLSNIIPERGESRAAARKRAITENPDSFSSSFLGSKEMDNLEKTLGALDAGKKQVEDRNSIMNRVRELEGIDPLENPDQARAKLNSIYKFNKLNNISDPDKKLESYSSALLRGTKYSLQDKTIEDAGGIVGNEATYTLDVVTKVRENIADHVRKENLGAPEKQVQSTVDRILKESPYGRAFIRGTARDEAMTFKDKASRDIAFTISDAKNNDELIAAINKGSLIIEQNPNWTTEDAAFMTQPIINALDDMGINALDEWQKLGLTNEGSLKEQKHFMDKMYALYRSYFSELPKKVIDQKIRNDIKNDGTLNTIIKTGNTIAALKADQFKAKIEMWNKKDLDVTNFFLDDRPLYSKTGDKLYENLKKKFGNTEEWKNLGPNDIQNIYEQVKIVSEGHSTLEEWQEDTFDLAVFRFLSNMGGYDPNTGFMNLRNPEFTIMSIDRFSNMSKADTNILMDGLKDFLPKTRDRTASARKAIKADKSASFDQKVHAYLEKHPPLHKITMGEPGDNASWEDRKAWFRQVIQQGDLTWDRFRALGALHFGWGDPEGSVGEKMNKKIGGWLSQMWEEFREFQEIEQKSQNERLQTTAQNKYNPN